jgi:hypothetical protein
VIVDGIQQHLRTLWGIAMFEDGLQCTLRQGMYFAARRDGNAANTQ